ncbi:MAG: hypothetical protein ACOCT8_01335, partial [Actinomycetota bacterium]
MSLALIVAGVTWLEALHPQLAPPQQRGMPVEDLPPLALEETRTCVRGTDDDLADELRERFPRHGRVSSAQVHRCPGAFDGAEVTYVGEAIGELLPRDGGAWLQVNDDAYALEVGPLIGHREHAGFNTGLSVWLPDGLHERVESFGRSAHRGDVVELRGTIHRTDPADGGGLTLRADELEVRADGVAVAPPLHRIQAVVAAVLAVLAIAAM